MIITKAYFQQLLERKSEDDPRIIKMGERLQESFLGLCPWFKTDGIANIEGVFRFIAREKVTDHMWERLKNGESDKFTDFRRKCLLLSGGCGAGKTTISAFIASEISGVEIYNADEVDFNYSALSNADFCERYPELVWESHDNAVIIDDFGSEQSRKRYGNAAFSAGLLERLYSQWCFNGSTCVITTNLSFPEVREMYGDRAASRIREMFDFVRFKSIDYRTQSSKTACNETEMKHD